MKTITFTCDICGVEIPADRLITLKGESGIKHFCLACAGSDDFENIVAETNDKNK